MKTLYIDPVFGISGDMMIAALIHAGYPFEEFLNTVKKMPLPIPEIIPERLSQGVIEGIHLNIERSDIHLTIDEMYKVIQEMDIQESVKSHARSMLHIIVEAESKIHHISHEELHLHELSNIDTLIDLIGVAHGIHFFGIEEVFSGPVPCGSGTIRTSHGIIPNPPPVTLEILKDFNMVFFQVNLELTTPTGAAIIRHYARPLNQTPVLRIESIGYGVGTYKSERPDVLRVFIGDTPHERQKDHIWTIETDIDDMDMEYLGAVADRVRDAGAVDCLFFPVYMKKGRLGVRFSVLVGDDSLEKVKDAVFKETSTFGIRIRRDFREVLKREIKKIDTSFGAVHVKYGYNHQDKCIKTHMEFEDIKGLADKMGIPYKELYDAVKKEIK
ncbi:MAG TPA: nickel pincer cofactor biosynthesis protein LarC [Syntrophorhabdaceae bacterium]|nr:nickel pincer cofactor biosynthesis protein LarC [Syntrophorhabdaceae bacterium]